MQTRNKLGAFDRSRCSLSADGLSEKATEQQRTKEDKGRTHYPSKRLSESKQNAIMIEPGSRTCPTSTLKKTSFQAGSKTSHLVPPTQNEILRENGEHDECTPYYLVQ